MQQLRYKQNSDPYIQRKYASLARFNTFDRPEKYKNNGGHIN